MQSVRYMAWTVATIVIASLVGCDDPPPESVERIRSIKPYYVVEPAGGRVRGYSGIVVASNTSALSFANSGTVQTVEVNRGDRVVEGQILATLDPEQFQLNVAAARSEMATVQAEYENYRLELDRQRQLFEREWVAKAVYDQAVSAFDAAEGRLNLARSRLGSAQRDLAKARLLAPFDGVISVRDIEPFVEISRGQAAFQIDSEGNFEIDFSVPDSVVGSLAIGTPASIDVAMVVECGCIGRITEIGVVTGAANTVPITAALLSDPDGLLAGMAVDVSIVLADDGGSRGLLVPIVAIAPGDENAKGYIFKYEPENGVVRKTSVRGEGANGNFIGITEGLEAGDIIAAAGVSFLRDGQSVKLIDD